MCIEDIMSLTIIVFLGLFLLLVFWAVMHYMVSPIMLYLQRLIASHQLMFIIFMLIAIFLVHKLLRIPLVLSVGFLVIYFILKWLGFDLLLILFGFFYAFSADNYDQDIQDDVDLSEIPDDTQYDVPIIFDDHENP